MPGTLKITAAPWAIVTIDGVSHGQTPVELELSPGRHRVIMVNGDYGKRESIPVRIRSGKLETVHRKWGTALQ